MWYKVQELTAMGLNKSQIRLETGLDRATIRKYQAMDEDGFHHWIGRSNCLPRKLKDYREQVKTMLERAPYLSSAQVEDRLKEQNENLPGVHSKTVYNFVQSIRKEYGIAKPDKTPRAYMKLPELPYGQQAQVDFGESWMRSKYGNRLKVHFFTMVLSRSRYKYVLFQKSPFSAESASAAHTQAFIYFQGVPHQILYDQDKVFIHAENLGDYLLTSAFHSFCKTHNFQAIFCRKADPESKGKIENVVKYIKQNFLRGREFVNIEMLNQQALAWLERTGNAKKHAAIQLIPKKEWQKEKSYLLPLRPRGPEPLLHPYKVRKDHTFCYKSNYYTVPMGTYEGPQSIVLLKFLSEEIHVYSKERSIICVHELCKQQGKTIAKSDHQREKSKTLKVMSDQVLKQLGNTPMAREYLNQFQRAKSRYYRDNLQYIMNHFSAYPEAVITETLTLCAENQIFNGKDLISILERKQQEQRSPKPSIAIKEAITNPLNDIDITVSTSDINIYENIF